VYKSKYENGVNVDWAGFEMKLQDLCFGDVNTRIVLDVFDYKTSGDHQYIASTEFSISQVLNQEMREFTLINPKKKQKDKEYKGSGTIVISNCQIQRVYSFMEYIYGGCEICLEVAVDFTGSNKHPSSPSSLHYIDPDGVTLNPYQQALSAVSDILLHYDSDKKVPMYGFGGKINNIISHCFSLSRHSDDPFAYGIEGIMDMYKSALSFVNFSGPTLFAELLQQVITPLEQEPVDQSQQIYKILLILTDGEIHDMQETINWVVRGSSCPLSIVIVGIGNENFSKMHVLDADDSPLVDSSGRRMLRDIVQFVPYREVNNSPYRLAREVLDEIPREIVNYFRMKGIEPNPPLAPRMMTFKSNIEEYFEILQKGK
jgi:hypothetical protein